MSMLYDLNIGKAMKLQLMSPNIDYVLKHKVLHLIPIAINEGVL